MKKALLLTAVITAAVAAKASVLLWQVSSDDSFGETIDNNEWNTARLVAVSGVSGDDVSGWNQTDKRGSLGSTTYVTGYTVVDTGAEFTTSGTSLIGAPMGSALAANISDLSGANYAYYVELVNSSAPTVTYARSDAVTYTSLVDSGYIAPSGLSLGNLASITPWHAGNYTVVPEPTSAILMLFGAAFLGLKRKNRSLA